MRGRAGLLRWALIGAVTASCALAGDRLVLDFNSTGGSFRPIRTLQQPTWTTVPDQSLGSPHVQRRGYLRRLVDRGPQGANRTSGGGRTWYRKRFTRPLGRAASGSASSSRRFAKWFEVTLNGRLLGRPQEQGFSPFGFDLTPHLRFDGPNVLAVMCDNRLQKDPMGRERPRPRSEPRIPPERPIAGRREEVPGAAVWPR